MGQAFRRATGRIASSTVDTTPSAASKLGKPLDKRPPVVPQDQFPSKDASPGSDLMKSLPCNACAHGGLVNEAWGYFHAITKYGMVPKIEHYACMIDVLARAGHLTQAYNFLCAMSLEPSPSMLGALFNGCIKHRRVDLAEIVGKRLIELDPDHDGRYVGLSKVYAVMRRWDEARNTREAMESRGVKKIPGYSYVEVFGLLHRFIAHDKVHIHTT